MMKALDADAVRRAVCNVDIPACVTEEQFTAVLGNVCAALQGLEAIAAVPLEPLCEWLAVNASYIFGDYKNTWKFEARHWEHEIREWMKEEGLDAAD